jgi:cytochrome b561
VETACEDTHYTRTAVALHWIFVALIGSALCIGWLMTVMKVTPLKLRLYSWHKWLGVTVLALLAVRGAWRRFHPPPPLAAMPSWQRLSARTLHGALYAMLLVQPLTGWIFSNASGYPIVYLRWVPLPNLIGRNPAMANAFERYHRIGALLFATAIVLHALAALKHHCVDRDDTLRRMLRWRAT